MPVDPELLAGLRAAVEAVPDNLALRVHVADVEFAKTLCATCPVRLDCLNGALERREPWGVWGGEWFVQGVVVPRKRPRGRPRKSEVAA